MKNRYKRAINLVLVYCAFVSVFLYFLPFCKYLGFSLPFYGYYGFVSSPILATIFFFAIFKISKISQNISLNKYNKIHFCFQMFYLSISVFFFFFGKYIFLENLDYMEYAWVFSALIELVVITYLIKIHLQLVHIFNEKYFIFYSFAIGFIFVVPFVIMALTSINIWFDMKYLIYGKNILAFTTFVGYFFTWIKINLPIKN